MTLRSELIPVSSVRYNKQVIQDTDIFGAYYLNELNPINSITSYVPFLITPKYVGVPDLISYDIYGSTEYWWIICLYNGIVIVHEELFAGRTIKIPDIGQVTSWLTRTKNIKSTPSEEFVTI
jgi:hypothetical protein